MPRGKQPFLLHWLVFTLLSLAIHGMILRWIGEPGVSPPPIGEKVRPTLLISLTHPLSQVKTAAQAGNQDQAHAEKRHARIHQPAKPAPTVSAAQVQSQTMKTQAAVEQKPDNADASPQDKATANQNGRPLGALELQESARQLIPGIIQAMEAQESLERAPTVFAPHFRKQLEAARREAQRQQEAARSNQTRPTVEVIGETSHSKIIRVGKTCWQAPIDTDAISEPYATSIWKAMSNCPDQAGIDFTQAPGRIKH